MAGGRRGLVSSINNFTIDELVSEMLVNPQLLSKIKLYSNNNNMNATTREHASKAFNAYRIVRRQLSKAKKSQTTARVEAAKQARREQWLENNPKSLRYKTVPQILEAIETDSSIRANVSRYLSNTNSNLTAEYKKRLRMAMIAYYVKTNPDSPVLQKHLNKLIQE